MSSPFKTFFNFPMDLLRRDKFHHPLRQFPSLPVTPLRNPFSHSQKLDGALTLNSSRPHAKSSGIILGSAAASPHIPTGICALRAAEITWRTGAGQPDAADRTSAPLGIAPVHRKCILGQIVCSDAEEVGLFRQLIGKLHRRRRF